MEGKLRQLMKHEGINSTRLAEILGIQASGISHIMSGRNKPSFDFLLKLLQRFPQINSDWLLLDKGPMYRDEIKNKGRQNTQANIQAGSRTHQSGPGNSSGHLSGTNADVATPYNAGVGGTGGHGGFTSGSADYGSGTIRGGVTTGAAGEGLFGPDNNDIIPSGGPSYGSSGPSGGHITGHSIGNISGLPAAHQGGQMGQRANQHVPQQAMQQSVSQSVGFTRSASIERIVVFYKDKTFSEYQPE